MPASAHPSRCCDLVMKGGITSGILYPPAIDTIAEHFHLVGIGGTSAGAIAACAAAAAEFRRRHTGDASGFGMMNEIPDDLAGPGKLEGLFRPDKPTKGLHDLALDFLGMKKRSWLGQQWLKLRGVWAAVFYNKNLGKLVANRFGLCSGMANDNPPGPGEIKPLTLWLHKQIERIAGQEGRQTDCPGPLTFGELRAAPIPLHLADLMKGNEDKSIDLRAVTTCLSHGRPYSLPLTSQIWGFDPAEWLELFPEDVVGYLVRRAKLSESKVYPREGKLPLPVGDDMPVVVAARMSLSFPGLFSMIPLYAVDYDHPEQPLRKVWFSDGGITSNLPIQFFDGLFPRWPTLAMNLQDCDASGNPSRAGVDDTLTYMIKRPEDGTNELWHVFDGRESRLKDVAGFGMAIFLAAQNWHDNNMLSLPGYRDRVVEIWLRAKEGGINLNMEPDTIRGLKIRGAEAGRKLCERFMEWPPEKRLSWNAHRWTRYRSGMAGLAKYLHGFERATEQEHPDDVTLAELLADRHAPPQYKFENDAQWTAAAKATEELRELVKGFQGVPTCQEEGHEDFRPFCGRPRPPELGARAPM